MRYALAPRVAHRVRGGLSRHLASAGLEACALCLEELHASFREERAAREEREARAGDEARGQAAAEGPGWAAAAARRSS